MQIKSCQWMYYKTRRVHVSSYSLEAKERLRLLTLYEKLISEGCHQSVALEAIGWSRAKRYRLKKRYEVGGMKGLEPCSRRPHRVRVHTWSRSQQQAVLKLRRAQPLWGKLVLVLLDHS